jgi:hypothetical protein
MEQDTMPTRTAQAAAGCRTPDSAAPLQCGKLWQTESCSCVECMLGTVSTSFCIATMWLHVAWRSTRTCSLPQRHQVLQQPPLHANCCLLTQTTHTSFLSMPGQAHPDPGCCCCCSVAAASILLHAACCVHTRSDGYPPCFQLPSAAPSSSCSCSSCCC